MDVILDALNNLVQPLLEMLLELLLPIVLGAAVLWIRQMIARAKGEIDERNLNWLLVLARQFVIAAEQSGLIGELENAGEAKKQMVVELLQAAADARGIKLDAEALSAIIEAAVVDALGFSDAPAE